MTPTQDTALTATRVAVDMFSGKVNPNWYLDAQEQQAIAVELGAAIAANQTLAVPEPSLHLGYRGFVLLMDEDSKFHRVRVYRGVITLEYRDQTPPVAYADSQRTLELVLLEAARTHLSDSEFTFLEQEMSQ